MRVDTTVFSQNSGENFEGLGISAEAVLIKTSQFFALVFEPNAENLHSIKNTVSVLPAPGTKSVYLIKDLKTWTPSSMALSMSSRMLVVLPLRMIVDSLQSSVYLLKMTTFSEAISSTPTSSDVPTSSGVGASSLERMVALTALATLRSSNLERILTTIILYLSRK